MNIHVMSMQAALTLMAVSTVHVEKAMKAMDSTVQVTTLHRYFMILNQYLYNSFK